jgi:ABC-type sulfate transport system substrate-binding protein
MRAADDRASRRSVLAGLAGAAAGGSLALTGGKLRAQSLAPVRLLNVSYDPTRELYKDVNAAYADYWKGRTGQRVTIDMSHGGSGAQARALASLPPGAFVTEFYKRVPVLDSGARGATVTFTQRGIGDVLVCWENEAHLAQAEFGADKFDIVIPPISILAEPPVALLDKVVDRKGTRTVAQGYLNFLYSPLAQDLIGKNFYRPRNPQALAKYGARFPKIPMVTIADTFGGWTRAQATHFADGGVFDQIHKG